MSTRFVLTLRVGPDILVIGPPGAFGGRPDGHMIGRPGLHGQEDARRWITRACQEPDVLIRVRQHLIIWIGDSHHINRMKESDLPNYLADLCARGSLSMWASRPMGGHDAHNLARVKLQSASHGPIETWSIPARIETVLKQVPDYLTGTSGEEFRKLISPEAIKMTTGILAVWAVGHAFGVSEVIDVLLLALAAYSLGRSVRELADKITHVLHLITSARRDADLQEAARELAEVVAIIGVAAFVALVTHAATKMSKGALKAKKEPVRKPPAPKSEAVQRLQERPQPQKQQLLLGPGKSSEALQLPPGKSAGAAEANAAATPPKQTRFVSDVTVTDRSTGRTIQGTVDLKPTLDRINEGRTYPHRNDGSEFRNRPNRSGQQALPSQPPGYYKEYVHPTPGFAGPGPQRVVIGQGGEIYYTADHYETFVRVNPPGSGK